MYNFQSLNSVLALVTIKHYAIFIHGAEVQFSISIIKSLTVMLLSGERVSLGSSRSYPIQR